MDRTPSSSSAATSRFPLPAIGAESSLSQRLTDFATAWLCGVGLFIVLMTLTPFQGGQESAIAAAGANEGNVVNQIGYLTLGAVYLFAMLFFVDRRVLLRAVSPGWLVVLAIALWSCGQAQDPAAAMRGVILTFLSMTLVAGILLLPRSQRAFIGAGANAVLVLLVIDYAAVFVVPEIAVHTAAGGEPWHAGSWRGHLLHKNFAAPVFSVLAMFGIYCWRSGAPRRGAIILLLSAIFVLNTQSKTTTGFLPLAIAIVLLARVTGKPLLTVFLHLLMTAAIACLTIGTVMSHPLLALVTSFMEDPTFTGRDAIWRYGIERLPERFWQGYGYFGFWLSSAVVDQEANYEAAWDVRGIVSGHNAYLDTLLMFGVPAGMVVIMLLMGKPLIDYLKAYRQADNRPLADFLLMVVVFMTYAGMLESFLLNRADPLWLVLVLGSYGLAIAARNTVR